MRGKVGSLNAAVAGSVLLFEAAAQRPGRAALEAVSEASGSSAAEPTDTAHDPATLDAVAEAAADASTEHGPRSGLGHRDPARPR